MKFIINIDDFTWPTYEHNDIADRIDFIYYRNLGECASLERVQHFHGFERRKPDEELRHFQYPSDHKMVIADFTLNCGE